MQDEQIKAKIEELKSEMSQLSQGRQQRIAAINKAIEQHNDAMAQIDARLNQCAGAVSALQDLLPPEEVDTPTDVEAVASQLNRRRNGHQKQSKVEAAPKG